MNYRLVSAISIIAAGAFPALAQEDAATAQEDQDIAQEDLQPEPLSDTEVVSLGIWGDQDIYTGGVSAERFIDDMEVLGETGEEIGDVEDIIVGPDGRVRAIVAEVGGFWDIGDTHVSIPFDQVEMVEGGEAIMVPLREENVEEYDISGTASLDQGIVAGIDDEPLGPRSWRMTELIGDYARLTGDEDPLNYGYINDVILKDGAISAVVIQPAYDYGGGYEAYPYPGVGWNPGTPYYDLPYTQTDVEGAREFEYERLEGN